MDIKKINKNRHVMFIVVPLFSFNFTFKGLNIET